MALKVNHCETLKAETPVIVRFEAFTAATLRNVVFWCVLLEPTFREKVSLHLQGRKNQRARNFSRLATEPH
jgi:hypothetical protein